MFGGGVSVAQADSVEYMGGLFSKLAKAFSPAPRKLVKQVLAVQSASANPVVAAAAQKELKEQKAAEKIAWVGAAVIGIPAAVMAAPVIMPALASSPLVKIGVKAVKAVTQILPKAELSQPTVSVPDGVPSGTVPSVQSVYGGPVATTASMFGGKTLPVIFISGIVLTVAYKLFFEKKTKSRGRKK